MKNATRGLILFLAVLSLMARDSLADMINTKDGREVRGIVVEDYKDRVIFSTADGEISMFKSDIAAIHFDSEEDNLIKLAEQAQARKEYSRAYNYYEKAAKINPTSKRAKDGVVFLQGYLFRKEEVKKLEDIKRRESLEHYGAYIATEGTYEEEFKENTAKLQDLLGIKLKAKDGMPQVDSVERNSPAYEAHIKKGDLLVAIWGKLTGYMPLKEVMDLLLEKPALEIKCTIERTIPIKLKGRRFLTKTENLMGASFAMEFDGLTVSDVKEDSSSSMAGLRKGDLVVAINGSPTRYTPLKKAIEMIKRSKGDQVRLTIRRDILVWRRTGI